MKTPLDQTMALVQKLCEANNARLTEQRKMVLDVLLGANRALSAYELAKICNQRFERKIIATSVYRILEFFIELRIAYRLDTINKFIACQHISQESENRFPIFVICVYCNEVSELSVPNLIMQNMRTLVNTPQFKVIDSKIELKGACKKCEYDSNVIANQTIDHCSVNSTDGLFDNPNEIHTD